MPDIISPRVNTTQQVNFERFGVSFANGAATTGKLIGSIPTGSFIIDVSCDVNIAFNAGTTNVLSLGTTKANANELLAAGDIAPGTVGYNTNARGKGMLLTKVATTAAQAGGDDPMGGIGIWAKYTSTGTAPTAGLAVFTVAYIPPNDN